MRLLRTAAAPHSRASGIGRLVVHSRSLPDNAVIVRDTGTTSGELSESPDAMFKAARYVPGASPTGFMLIATSEGVSPLCGVTFSQERSLDPVTDRLHSIDPAPAFVIPSCWSVLVVVPRICVTARLVGLTAIRPVAGAIVNGRLSDGPPPGGGFENEIWTTPGAAMSAAVVIFATVSELTQI